MEHSVRLKEPKFLADDQRILTLSNNSKAYFWDVNTGKQIGLTIEHRDESQRATLHIDLNKDETKVITCGTDGIAKVWDIAVDWDFPKEKIVLQATVLTGTRLNPLSRQIEVLEQQDWRKLKKEYMKTAREHYRKCKYPHANVFRKLFPEEADKVRRLE